MLQSLSTEWVDLGLLVLSVGCLAVIVMVYRTGTRTVAAHVAGAVATIIAIAWVVGLLFTYPGKLPAIVVVAPLLALVPHLLARQSERSAAGLWLLGSGGTVVFFTLSGFAVLEQIVGIALMAIPWGLAAVWAASPSTTSR